jgi:rare lipoprotein A
VKRYARGSRLALPLLIVATVVLAPALAGGQEESVAAPAATEDALAAAAAVELAGVTASDVAGMASWYGARFHGRTTANGEVYDMHAATAAHKRLPFNTVVRVVDVVTQRSTVVRINDRGPFVPGRIIDLSMAAAQQLQMMASGVAQVRLEIVARGDPPVSYYLQLGSFADRANAIRFADRLQAAGFVAEVQLIATPTPALSRVVIPHLAQQQVAPLQARLRASDFATGLLREHRP